MNKLFATLVMISIVGAPTTAQQAKPEEKSAAPKPAADKPAQPAAPDMAAAMQEYMKSIAPGEPHKQLEAFVGKWNTVTKMWMAGPQSPPTESAGTSEVRWVLDKRFIMEEHKGQMMGMPYLGIGLTGYDNDRNMYVASWTSNMSTALLTMAGARSPDGKTFTYYGQMDEPMLKVFGRTVKYVCKMVDADKHVFTIYDLHAGDDYKVIEITYTRGK